jgi:ribose/xylose/arabinose/galactoside ABC-type transport system permease subunit
MAKKRARVGPAWTWLGVTLVGAIVIVIALKNSHDPDWFGLVLGLVMIVVSLVAFIRRIVRREP